MFGIHKKLYITELLNKTLKK